MIQVSVGFICFCICALGILWQKHLFSSFDEEPKHFFNINYFEENFLSTRMRIPTYASCVFLAIVIINVVGSLFWNAFVTLDQKESDTISLDYSLILTLFGLAIVVIFKSYFAPIFLSIALSWSFYIWFQYDRYDLVPLFSIVVDVLMQWAPVWLKTAYTFSLISYLTVSSLISTYFSFR